MRNSSNKHNCKLWVLLLLALPAGVLGAAKDYRIGGNDLVEISADEAWEDIQPDVVHFRGQFELRAGELRMSADRATLHGTLDNPEHLQMVGNPARISLSAINEGVNETVTGEALNIVYQRASHTIIFNGDARLTQGTSSMRSTAITYDIEQGRFKAQGGVGLQIEVQPTVQPAVRTEVPSDH